jgi:tRNA-splicing ligase RtcB
MADHHKGYAVPIGGVVAYKNAISPSGVGFDIACGNKAVRLDVPLSRVQPNIGSIMDEIFATISFGIGRNNAEPSDHEILENNYPGWELEATKELRQMTANQLGTVGSGNHYVDIFRDELDRVWIGVHFGSRGLGHKTATWFLSAAGAKDGMDVDPCILPVESDLGEQYIKAMTLAGKYAYAGRDWVCARVARILGGEIVEEIHNHHNFAWREEHGGEEFWVVRKGATPAFPGQKGFVGGSMGEKSVILEGVESPLNALTLNSTVHGAGRVMGRLEAKGKFKNGVCVREGKVKQEMINEWLERENVVLRGSGLDEAPQCYKRLPEVLDEHGDSVRILHTLTPLGVAMAGPNEFDPYKD